MNRFRSLVALFLCLCLLMLCTGAAFAVDLSRQNTVLTKMPHCAITGLQTNQYAADRPVIIFFPGSRECFSAYNTLSFIKSLEIFSDLDVDVLFITLPKANLWFRLWEKADQDLCDFLKDKYEAAQFPVIIDATSFGGYGGCFLTDLLRENGIPVQELNLADACNSNCVYSDWVRDIALAGTKVNIWGTDSEFNISKNTCKVIEELEGTENVSSMVLDCYHGRALYTAIHEHGLHSDLPKASENE